MKPLLAFLIAWSFGMIAYGQAFYIYHVDGEVFIRERKTTKRAASGDPFGKNQVVVVSENSHISLLNERGLEVFFDKKGEYSYDKVLHDLERSDAVVSPFFSFVWEKLKEHHDGDPHHAGNQPTGGVSRSEWAIHYPADSSVVIGREIRFAWRPLGDITYFSLAETDGTHIFKVGVGDSILILYPFSTHMKAGNYYHWRLGREGNATSGATSVLFLADDTFIDNFRNEERQLKAYLRRFKDPKFEGQELEKFYKSRRVLMYDGG